MTRTAKLVFIANNPTILTLSPPVNASVDPVLKPHHRMNTPSATRGMLCGFSVLCSLSKLFKARTDHR